MIRIRQVLNILIIFLLLALFGFALSWNPEPVIHAVEQRPALSVGVYILVLALSVVAAPLSSLPIVPFAAMMWGIALGSVISIVGWWFGALIAFSLARYAGRPILSRLVSLERLEQWEKRVPKKTKLGAVVLAHMIFPVELVSYTFGFSFRLSLQKYALASLVGITPFAVMWVSIGSRAVAGQWYEFVLMSGLFVVLFVLIYWLWVRYTK